MRKSRLDRWSDLQGKAYIITLIAKTRSRFTGSPRVNAPASKPAHKCTIECHYLKVGKDKEQRLVRIAKSSPSSRNDGRQMGAGS